MSEIISLDLCCSVALSEALLKMDGILSREGIARKIYRKYRYKNYDVLATVVREAT